MSEELETLAAKLHDVYLDEKSRQRKKGASYESMRWTQPYSELPEQIKDLDRALASFIIERENKWKALAGELKEIPGILYSETADYIRINNLGDVHYNQSMKLSRDILAKARNEQRN